MKLMETLKSMFTNKPEVVENRIPSIKVRQLRESNIYRTIGIICDAITEKNDEPLICKDNETLNELMRYTFSDFQSEFTDGIKNWIKQNTSILYFIEIENKDLYLFIQIAEIISEYQVYMFTNKVTFIINFSLRDLENLITKTRYINNPIVEQLREDLYHTSFDFLHEDLIKDSYLEREKFVRYEKLELTDEDELPVNRQLEKINGAVKVSVISLDVPTDTTEKILYEKPNLAKYLRDSDIFKLSKITFSAIIDMDDGMDVNDLLEYFTILRIFKINDTQYRLICTCTVYDLAVVYTECAYERINTILIQLQYLLKDKFEFEHIANSIKKDRDMLKQEEPEFSEDDIDEIISEEIVDTSKVPEDNRIDIKESNNNKEKETNQS